MHHVQAGVLLYWSFQVRNILPRGLPAKQFHAHLRGVPEQLPELLCQCGELHGVPHQLLPAQQQVHELLPRSLLCQGRGPDLRHVRPRMRTLQRPTEYQLLGVQCHLRSLKLVLHKSKPLRRLLLWQSHQQVVPEMPARLPEVFLPADQLQPM